MSHEQPIRILASTSATKIMKSELNRRRFLALSGAAASAAALAACSTDSDTGSATQATGGDLESSLSVYSWGDYDDPDLVSEFTDELGPTVTFDAFNSNEELISKLVAARGTSGYDIVVPTGPFIPQMIENGLLSKLNLDLIPNIADMDPDFLGRDWDPNNEYSICKAWGTTGFVYDKTKITRELTNWSDFIDAAQNEASGKTSVLDDPAPLLGIYYWANGIDWNTTDEADLAAAEEFLTTQLAPHISAFDSYPGGAAIPQAQHMLMQSWNGDARIGIMESEDPDRWQWVLGSPDTELWMDNWAIAEGAPNPEAAHAFINYVLTPEASLRELDYIGYHTGGTGIEDTARAEGLEMLDLVFFDEEQISTMHTQAIGDAQQRIVEIWDKTKASAGA
ncbi:spermidine/putrescine ABC transporter substrate-binding protein [Salinibacterium sp. NG253]|uniref:polyamine ABC transporter substrate-binding protein n=1 Tax=Salinibacterium sp. NG253 TaxID=2792039 RepID=UPI0018CD7F72|nr:spermidine/putrescine ABC transporter substrate-binding protein [Salinibacterium sp. NG253]MBH0117045.1 spermidine/putrescine ABC transporter substrate-binding protein [Salinibacterium sp. NG253]